jgi:hypothetical protein
MSLSLQMRPMAWIVCTVTTVFPFWASFSESLVIEGLPTGFSLCASAIVPLNCVDFISGEKLQNYRFSEPVF